MNKLRSILLLLSLCFSSISFSKNIDLKIDMKWEKENKTKVFHSTVVATLGEEWTIPLASDETLKIKMKISENTEDSSGIILEAKIFEIIGDHIRVIASPQVITTFGNEAQISVSSDSGEHLELKLLARERE